MAWRNLTEDLAELWAAETNVPEQHTPEWHYEQMYQARLRSSRESRANLLPAVRKERRRKERAKLKSTPEGRAKLKRWQKTSNQRRVLTAEQREKHREANRRYAAKRRAKLKAQKAGSE